MTSGLRVLHGDCCEVLAGLEPESVDAVVTDPPYELGFMGKEWDKSGVTYQVATWAAVLRVLKPGGHLLAFGGTRTYHRMTCAIEDAGFEIRDCLQWIYGSGFPKSRDVSKAIDKEAGAERQTRRAAGINGGLMALGTRERCLDCGRQYFSAVPCRCPRPDKEAITSAAQQWQGWGTALKPAYESIVLARKPLIGTVAQNVQQYGTGAINVDGCRVETTENLNGGAYAKAGSDRDSYEDWRFKRKGDAGAYRQPTGRWPANILHDGSDEVVALFPQTTSGTPLNTMHTSPRQESPVWNADNCRLKREYLHTGFGDSGSAARFFYTAKASRSERGEGNTHPTVKPIALIRYLVRLITPPGGLVLDPFVGSGTTLLACKVEGMRGIGIDQDAETVRQLRARYEQARRPLIEDPLEV